MSRSCQRHRHVELRGGLGPRLSLREEIRHESSGNVAGAKLGIVQNLAKERHSCLHASDSVFCRAPAACAGWPVFRSGAQVTSFASSGSYSSGTVQPGYTPESSRTPGPLGSRSCTIVPGDGKKLASGSSAPMRHSIAHPRQRDILLREWQRLAGSDPQLELNQIVARYQLRHRMLHLQSRVHFQEIEIAAIVGQKLDGAQIVVTGRPRNLQRRFAHGRPQFGMPARPTATGILR